jgi:hypothetical protein
MMSDQESLKHQVAEAKRKLAEALARYDRACGRLEDSKRDLASAASVSLLEAAIDALRGHHEMWGKKALKLTKGGVNRLWAQGEIERAREELDLCVKNLEALESELNRRRAVGAAVIGGGMAVAAGAIFAAMKAMQSTDKEAGSADAATGDAAKAEAKAIDAEAKAIEAKAEAADEPGQDLDDGETRAAKTITEPSA